MRLPIALLLFALGLPAAAAAQGREIAFGGLRQDTSLPVEVTADSLSVDQAEGTAVFSGAVLVVQGELRLSAAEVRVEYGADQREIRRLHATGGVTIANATDAAEAREAVYTVATGEVVMSGDVLLTQGENAIAGQRLRLDLKSGTGTMEGRVTTVFRPGAATGGD
jgi:lipopolysaccharide export system protein LptA